VGAFIERASKEEAAAGNGLFRTLMLSRSLVSPELIIAWLD
jgi:hypothetical protein